jgi:hypothetical protein
MKRPNHHFTSFDDSKYSDGVDLYSDPDLVQTDPDHEMMMQWEKTDMVSNDDSQAPETAFPHDRPAGGLDFNETQTMPAYCDAGIFQTSAGKNNHALPPLRVLLIRSESGPLTVKHDARLAENKGLIKALGWNLIETYVCRLRRSPHPATFLGKGWVERITSAIRAHDIQIVIMDPDLTSIQQRVLEKTWK